MDKLIIVDSVLKKLVKGVNDHNINWDNEKQNLQAMIENGALVDRQWALSQIDDYCGDNRAARILDYGCGTGILNLLLLLKGYSHVHGVDVQEKFDNKILHHLEFNNASFNLIGENDRLPFDDASLDIISSSLVLEHVSNAEFYYSEAARVLKPGGVCFFNFPHRLKPYDSHSRCWFIHYFPKGIRKVLWDIFARQDGAYLNDYLFLRTMTTHKRLAKKYFSHAEDRTGDRIKQNNFVNYKGNSTLRNLAGKLMKFKYVGAFFVKIFAINASADLYLKK